MNGSQNGEPGSFLQGACKAPPQGRQRRQARPRGKAPAAIRPAGRRFGAGVREFRRPCAPAHTGAGRQGFLYAEAARPCEGFGGVQSGESGGERKGEGGGHDAEDEKNDAGEGAGRERERESESLICIVRYKLKGKWWVDILYRE